MGGLWSILGAFPRPPSPLRCIPPDATHPEGPGRAPPSPPRPSSYFSSGPLLLLPSPLHGGGIEHQPLGAHVVKGDLHQGVAPHLLHGQDHPLSECLVAHHVPLLEGGQRRLVLQRRPAAAQGRWGRPAAGAADRRRRCAPHGPGETAVGRRSGPLGRLPPLPPPSPPPRPEIDTTPKPGKGSRCGGVHHKGDRQRGGGRMVLQRI